MGLGTTIGGSTQAGRPAAPMTIDNQPSLLSTAVALGAGFVAVSAASLSAPAALPIGVIGLGFIIAGLTTLRRRRITIGTISLLAAGLLAGSKGAEPVELLIVVMASIFAWDAATMAMGLGQQIGREVDTSQLEIVHLAGSGGVGLLGIIVAYSIERFMSGNQAVFTISLLLIAGAILTSAITDRAD